MNGIEEFEHDSYQDRESIKKYLLAIVEGFEKGSVSFRVEQDSILMPLDNFLRFKIKAKRREEKNKLYISISWKEKQASSRKKENIVIGS
ncbi:MAG: amphi-Trp domain-containing protein [Desulfobacterales bacterium]|nr:amphi-Trp domain-containing protein [Desulfobacterales bacterium]